LSELKEFLKNADVGVTSSGDALHIGVSLLEYVHGVSEGLEWLVPTFLDEAAIDAGITTMDGVMVSGIAMAYVGPILGMAGVFMALGSGYEEAREEIQNEATASGFAQGFVAGILNMSPRTTSWLFGQHGVIQRHPMDPEADVLEMKAHNRGVIAGYTLANMASEDQKKSFVFEIREFTGDVPVGAWTDRDKIDYVIEYAAKLRLHFLQENEE
jgi:hypothetical protein